MAAPRSRRTTQLARVVLVAALLALTAGCPGSDSSTSPIPTGSASIPGTGGSGQPTTGPTGKPGDPGQPTQAELDRFAQRCDADTSYLRAAVEYPRELVADLDRPTSYEVAVDATGRAPSVPPREDTVPGNRTVLVRCLVAARLVGVGDDAVVSSDETATGDGGWRYRQFTPQGRIEWSWTVTFGSPADQQLRLELRPAIAVDRTSTVELGSVSLVTDVQVRATRLERLAAWAGDQLDPLKIIGAVLSVVVLGVIGFLVAFRKKWAELRATGKPEDEPAPKPQPTRDPAPRRRPRGRRRGP